MFVPYRFLPCKDYDSDKPKETCIPLTRAKYYDRAKDQYYGDVQKIDALSTFSKFEIGEKSEDYPVVIEEDFIGKCNGFYEKASNITKTHSLEFDGIEPDRFVIFNKDSLPDQIESLGDTYRDWEKDPSKFPSVTSCYNLRKLGKYGLCIPESDTYKYGFCGPSCLIGKYDDDDNEELNDAIKEMDATYHETMLEKFNPTPIIGKQGHIKPCNSKSKL